MKMRGPFVIKARDVAVIAPIASSSSSSSARSRSCRLPAPRSPAPRSLQVAFTLIELLAVIAIMGVLAALLVGLAPAAGAKMRESRIRAELQQLITAIEEYKARYGFFPPDGLAGLQPGYARPELNPLYYELTGMLVINPFDPAGYFQSIDGAQKLNSFQLSTYFGRTGIANSSPDKKRILNQSFKPSQHANLFNHVPGQPDIELLIVPQPWPAADRAGSPLSSLPTIVGYDPVRNPLNPWRYVSSNPTNNPASYDLWAEFWRGKQKIIIGNWKQ